MKKGIAILGSTGSIGTQTLEVIQKHPDLFSVEVLTAQNNADLLVKQAIQFVPNTVVIGNPDKYNFVKESLQHLPIKVFSGNASIAEVVSFDSIGIVVTAMVGYAGLLPTINALKAGKHIALANKETLVVAGSIIRRLAFENNAYIVPVDSEHSAIYQCLTGEDSRTIEKIVLTASGGPFREKTLDFMRHASVKDALNHPNWCMGNKITIDSASLMNKGLEAIEAHWLFNVKPEQIEVVIHPQSIIHSMVQFIDGSVKAQLGVPDMRVPIQYALAYPARIPSDFPRLDFTLPINMTFEIPDLKKFRNLALSFEVMKKGGNWPCIMNAANEVTVDAFLKEKIGFLDMPAYIEQVLEKSVFIEDPDFDDICSSDSEARIMTKEILNKYT
ncbi:MAG: 1-deoxy-D-xylulose-5-phosphate reductoisomerase, partial [Bacteroidales bacterium]|nr:1-deoxy-D-xylulose-5-phosphate reductoisomerase [Bacteroidales bacterium]